LKKKLLAATALFAFSPALADQPQPEPLPQPPAVGAPQDVPYPGKIALAVDATDLNRHIFSVQENIPVQKPGDMVLLYPEWLPGDHGPANPLVELDSLVITAAGKRVEWVRDVVNMFAFHIKVPDGASSIDVHFQFLSPPDDKEGRVVMTPDLIDLQWNTVVLYPAGYFSRDITLSPAVKLPAGFHFATALESDTTDHGSGGSVTFHDTTLNTLVDSPLYAGHYFSRIDLDPGARVPVHLNVFADRPEDLEMTPDQIAKHRALVQQAYKNFGSHHYDHYDFLFELSDQMSGIGLEHHRSSEDGVGRGYFTKWDKEVYDRDLLPHEFTHSWNGKFRRPADLWAPNFNVPEQDSLLWVYEGQTEYWGQILAARSGLFDHQQALESLATLAAGQQNEVGRSWRDLQDTTNDPIINMRRPLAWRNWERSEDYYVEGLLIWLDADTLIRQKTNNAKSLNDFARTFFGVYDGSYITDTYKFEDVVQALNHVLPYDWAGFLRTRLDGHGPGAPLDGITRGGYKLVFNDTENPVMKSRESERKIADFTYSIGLGLRGTTIGSVSWGSPAFKAGLTVGEKIIAVNGLAFDESSGLSDAIKQAHAGSKAPIEILVQADQHFRTVRIDYHDGLRYPHLERVPNTPALLDDILAALK
jgi:predicted metalloprotease with PDZ domain